MTDLPRIAAVILTWNSEAHIIACLTSLLASRAVNLSAVVVDNGSTDGTVTLIEASGLPVTLVQTGANLGYAGGNNVGIDHALAAGADFIFVVNDDTEVTPTMLSELAGALARDPRAAAAAPTIVHDSPDGVVWWAGGLFRVARGLALHEGYGAAVASLPQGSERPVDSLCGCGLLLRRAALESVGVFQADYFMYGEDVEWSLRARRAGWRLLHVPVARMVHKVAYPEGDPTPAKILLRDRNRRRMVRAHYRVGERVRFALWFYPTRLIHLARYLIRGEFSRARAIAAGMVAR